MWAEVVSPIGNAVGFVDDEQRDACRHPLEHLRPEALVREALRRDEQNVHFVAPHRGLDNRPLFLIVGVDGLSPHAHALGRRDLIAHEGQQWRNQQRRPFSFLSQQLRGDEIDEALAPSRLLHDQQSAAAFDDVADRVFLVLAKSRVRMTGADSKQFECALRVVNHDG